MQRLLRWPLRLGAPYCSGRSTSHLENSTNHIPLLLQPETGNTGGPTLYQWGPSARPWKPHFTPTGDLAYKSKMAAAPQHVQTELGNYMADPSPDPLLLSLHTGAHVSTHLTVTASPASTESLIETLDELRLSPMEAGPVQHQSREDHSLELPFHS